MQLRFRFVLVNTCILYKPCFLDLYGHPTFHFQSLVTHKNLLTELDRDKGFDSIRWQFLPFVRIKTSPIFLTCHRFWTFLTCHRFWTQHKLKYVNKNSHVITSRQSIVLCTLYSVLDRPRFLP